MLHELGMRVKNTLIYIVICIVVVPRICTRKHFADLRVLPKGLDEVMAFENDLQYSLRR